MDCGNDVPLCGVLTLESGYGTGYYGHDAPSVHGLWPQVDPFGTSACIAPTNPADPTEISSCYKPDDNDIVHQLQFVAHEWDKHGKCAGVTDVADFFAQICSLSSGPLQVMSDTRTSTPGDFEAMKTALVKAGYPVYSSDSDNQQLLLSACASTDGRWKLAAVSTFGTVCGGTTPSPTPAPTPSPPTPSPAPTPTPSPAPGQCVSGQSGPACSADGDCEGVEDCVRCASSGYCTDVPLAVLV